MRLIVRTKFLRSIQTNPSTVSKQEPIDAHIDLSIDRRPGEADGFLRTRSIQYRPEVRRLLKVAS